MIEGLRVLPFWQAHLAETRHDDRRDCGTCMKNNDTQRRRYLGCGFEPRMPGRLGLWAPEPMVEDWAGIPMDRREVDPVMHCAGYTTTLPEVQEIAMAFPQYKAGYLAEFLDDAPTRDFLVGCAVLEGAHNAHEAQRMRDAQKNGGS